MKLFLDDGSVSDHKFLVLEEEQNLKIESKTTKSLKFLISNVYQNTVDTGF